MTKLLRNFLLVASLCSTLALAAPMPEWVARSNRLAEAVQQDQGLFFPEGATNIGTAGFDTKIIDLAPNVYERRLAALKARRDALVSLRASEPDVKVQQDLDILISSQDRAIEGTQVSHQYLLNVVDAASIVNFGLSGLLDIRNKPERQALALVRLKRYAGTEQGYEPLVSLAKARTQEDLGRSGLVGPYVEELKQQLAKTDYFLKGISDLFVKAKLTGWEVDFGVLSKQLRQYDDWLRSEVLPRARTEVRLPEAVYETRLKQFGVDIGPEELIERASFDFLEVRDQMQVIARQIAAKRRWAAVDYRDVLAKLQSKQLTRLEILPRYWKRLKEIEAIMRREKLVTVPERKPVVRVATDAESAQTPAPFMSPPRLVGNQGEYGEFVLPLTNPHAKSNAKMDDFTYDAVTWTMAAHEARPGHEMQFAAMVERGISTARAVFAFNSANVEGWGLYSEALMLPFMPPEGQLASLQMRLLRMARAFLDPMVNLGRITPEQAKRFLMEQVLFSEPFSQQEIDRYAFDAPGQATSYYYGYVQLRAIRTQVEVALGKRFNLKAFNDFVLDQGLIPPKLLKQAVLDEFVPAQLAQPGDPVTK